MAKEYIGDGVYARYEDYTVILTTESGLVVTNRIVIEAEVLDKLGEYIRRAVYSKCEKKDDK